MDHSMDMSSEVSCKISMMWNWYTIDACFIADSWHVSSNGAFAATCIGTVLLVMTMEALRRLSKEYDEWILRSFRTRAASLETSQSDPLLQEGGSAKGATMASAKQLPTSPLQTRTVVFRASPLQQAVRSVLHAVALGVAYIVMLLVMSYNGYIIVCVLIGGALGKFFCDWMTRSMVVSAGRVVGTEGAGAVADEPSMCCG
ncbi:unnamed protein product [Discula destructiva]